MYVALLLVAVAAVTPEHGAMTTEHGAMKTEHGAMTTEHAAMTTEHGAMTTEHGAMTTEHGAMTTQHASPYDAMYLFDAILSPHTIYIDNNQGFTGPQPINNKCSEDEESAANGICVKSATVAPGLKPLDWIDYSIARVSERDVRSVAAGGGGCGVARPRCGDDRARCDDDRARRGSSARVPR